MTPPTGTPPTGTPLTGTPPARATSPSSRPLSTTQASDGPADPTGDGGLVRLRLDLAYDGTDFSGWAVQPDRRTVAGVLTEALTRQPAGAGPPARLVVAGRTDAGVHARGQVAHLDVQGPVSRVDGLGRWVHKVNRALPADLRLISARVAGPGFDARFSPLWRRYVYRVADPETVPEPLRRKEILAYPRVLDLELLNVAAQELLGLRDFAAFCKRRAGATTIRTLLDLKAGRDEGGLVEITVRADAFCHSMVRSLVGALLAVAEGRQPTAWPAEVLAGGVRVPGAHVAAAHGLTLEEVGYPPDADLARRAELTRSPRQL